MDRNAKVWGTTRTGLVYHMFDSNGHAECRYNIRQGQGELRSLEELVKLFGGQRVERCTKCTEKFELIGRFDEHMAAAKTVTASEARVVELMAAPAPQPLTQADVDAMLAVTPEMVQALRTLRMYPESNPDFPGIGAAIDILDNAGVYAAIDETPAGGVLAAISNCTCPPSYAANDHHDAGCPDAPAETPCCEHATMYHGARGCDTCACAAPRETLKAHQGQAAALADVAQGSANMADALTRAAAVTTEMIEALRTLRMKSRVWFDQDAQDAVDILDNAGVFAAIDEATGYDIDPAPERVSKCTCPQGGFTRPTGTHRPGCPGDPAEYGDNAFTDGPSVIGEEDMRLVARRIKDRNRGCTCNGKRTDMGLHLRACPTVTGGGFDLNTGRLI